MSIHLLIENNDLNGLQNYLEQHKAEAAQLVNMPDKNGDLPLVIALRAKPINIALLELLMKNGADTRDRLVMELTGQTKNLSVQLMIDHNNVELDQNESRPSPFEEIIIDSSSPLIYAVENNLLDMAQSLLAAGADPNWLPVGAFHPPLACAQTREMAITLLAAGAYIKDASVEVRRLLLNLTEDPYESQLDLSESELLSGMPIREGTHNPQEFTLPYRVRMIQTGKTAYWALNQLKATAQSQVQHPVWCANRFGQSLNILPDGRMIQIGGEHEDYYDSDFCIYNDVFVHHPDGRIQVFDYPRSVFPPTDFHTATLVGDKIYIIGRLGYPASALTTRVPVFTLDLTTYQIKEIETSGAVQRYVCNHVAQLQDNHIIRIWGGKCEDRVYHFDVTTHTWSLVQGQLETDPHKVKLDHREICAIVVQANKQVDAYWEGREAGGINEANDPQHKLAPEFFEIYLAQMRLGGEYEVALMAAFSMWSYLEGGSFTIDEYLPKVVQGDRAMSWIRKSVVDAYKRDGRMAEYDTCFKTMCALVSGEPMGSLSSSKEALIYLLYEQIESWMNDKEDARARAACNQLLALNPDKKIVKNVRRRLQEIDHLGIGHFAPSFVSDDINGNPIDLEKLRGRVVLLDFWATWCGPCINELPHLKRVVNAFADKPFTLISISLDENVEDAKKMIEQKSMNWTHILAGGWGETEFAQLYGVMGIPQIFLIDQSGRICAKGLRGREIDQAVTKLLASLN